MKDYDQVIFIPMSSGLSNTCQTAVMLSDDDTYSGKVFVVDNHRISVPQLQSVYDAGGPGRGGGKQQQKFKEILEKEGPGRQHLIIAVDTLEYLKKGGRITPAAAAIGTVLSAEAGPSPYRGGKLDSHAKTRGHEISLPYHASGGKR